MQLYKSSERLGALIDEMDMVEPVDLPAFLAKAKLDELSESYLDKLESCAKAIQQFEGEQVMLKAEATRLSVRAKQRENAADHLRQYVKDCMTLAKDTQVSAGTFKLSIQNNSSAALKIDPSVVVEKLPKALLFFPPPPPPQVDKLAIAALQEKGKPLPKGISLERGTHLRIR
jgi:hypothetical protein